MKPIAILIAMDKEYAQIERLLKELHLENKFLPLHCGIGKVNAAMTVTELICKRDISGVISSGCAGGNGKKVSVGDVVICTETTYHDVFCGAEAAEWDLLGLPERMSADKTMLDKCKESGADVKYGLFCTGDQFITTTEEMDKIRVRFPDVVAVDMETAAIAHVCHKHDIPFLSLRVISDTPGTEAHTEQYHNFWDTLAEKSFATMRKIIKKIAGA